MFNHPIVQLYFYFSISMLLVFSSSIYSLWPFVLLLVIVSMYNKSVIKNVINKFLPMLFFLPFMLIIYIMISLIFSQITFFEAIKNALLAFLKFILIILLMNFYLNTASSEKLIISIRSIWVKTGLNWRWVDDFFLFLSLSLRLYPTFQSNWINNVNSLKAIGIKSEKSNYGKLIQISKELPSMLIYQLNRSNDIALAMKLRGYGDLLGFQQSGQKTFRLADPIINENLFKLAEEEIKTIEKNNINLSKYNTLIKLYDRAEIINELV